MKLVKNLHLLVFFESDCLGVLNHTVLLPTLGKLRFSHVCIDRKLLCCSSFLGFLPADFPAMSAQDNSKEISTRGEPYVWRGSKIFEREFSGIICRLRVFLFEWSNGKLNCASLLVAQCQVGCRIILPQIITLFWMRLSSSLLKAWSLMSGTRSSLSIIVCDHCLRLIWCDRKCSFYHNYR